MLFEFINFIGKYSYLKRNWVMASQGKLLRFTKKRNQYKKNEAI